MNIAKRIAPNLILYLLFLILCAATVFCTIKYCYTDLGIPKIIILPTGVFLRLAASHFANLLGPADMATYINAANYFLLHKDHFEPYTIATWPPGFPLVLAGLFKFFGENDYPLKVLSLAAIIWALVFLFVYNSLPSIRNPLIKILLAILPLFFESIRQSIFMLNPFLSESFSLPAFIISISFFIKWAQTEQPRDLFWMSVFLATSAYFRGYTEIFGNFLIFVALLYVVLRIIKFLVIEKVLHSEISFKLMIKQVYQKKHQVFGRDMKSIMIATITFVLLLLPWRIHMYRIFGSFDWQQLSTWTLFWTPNLPNFLITNNVACHIYPTVCNILFKNNIQAGLNVDTNFYFDLTLMTFITHPLAWSAEKIKYFNFFWFGYSWSSLFTQIKLFFEGTLILLTGIATIFTSSILWLRYSNKTMKRFFWFSILFIIFNLILFTFYHYEARYSLFMKFYFIYSPAIFFIALRENAFTVLPYYQIKNSEESIPL